MTLSPVANDTTNAVNTELRLHLERLPNDKTIERANEGNDMNENERRELRVLLERIDERVVRREREENGQIERRELRVILERLNNESIVDVVTAARNRENAVVKGRRELRTVIERLNTNAVRME